jgi:BASS family bile acid:Na+ symporter
MLRTLLMFIAAHSIAALMLSAGLLTDHAVFRELVTRWKLVVRALAVVWIGVPILAVIVVEVLHMRSVATATLLVVAICPGVPMVLESSKLAHGDRDTTLLVLITTAIAALVMVPLWTAILARATPLELSISPRAVALVLVPNVLFPFAVGRIVSLVFPRIARPLGRACSIVFFVGIAIFVVVIVIKGVPVLRQINVRGVAGVVIVTLGAAIMGYFAGRPRPEDRVSVAFAAALGNPMLATAVVAPIFPSAEALPIIAAYLLLRTATLIPFNLWLRRHGSGGKRTPLPRDPGFPHDGDVAHARGNRSRGHT